MSLKIFGTVASETKAMVRQALKAKVSKNNPVAVIHDERTNMNYVRRYGEREVFQTRSHIVDGEITPWGEDIVDAAAYRRGLWGFGKVKQVGRFVVDMKNQTGGAIYSNGNVEICDRFRESNKYIPFSNIIDSFIAWVRKGDIYVHKCGENTYVTSTKEMAKQLSDATAGSIYNLG